MVKLDFEQRAELRRLLEIAINDEDALAEMLSELIVLRAETWFDKLRKVLGMPCPNTTYEAVQKEVNREMQLRETLAASRSGAAQKENENG